jgi:hypothetical protein
MIKSNKFRYPSPHCFHIKTFKIQFLTTLEYTVIINIVISCIKKTKTNSSYLKLHNLLPVFPFSTPSFPNLKSLVTTIPFLTFQCLTFFESTDKWNHAVFLCLCLVYFTYDNILQVHSCYCKWRNSLFKEG